MIWWRGGSLLVQTRRQVKKEQLTQWTDQPLINQNLVWLLQNDKIKRKKKSAVKLNVFFFLILITIDTVVSHWRHQKYKDWIMLATKKVKKSYRFMFKFFKIATFYYKAYFEFFNMFFIVS